MLFNELIQLKEKTNQGIMYLKDMKGNLVEKKFKYNPPISTDEINEFMNENKLIIPSEYKKLLEISNGFEIYNYQGIDGFKIFGTNDIVKINKLIKDSYGTDWINNILIGIECIGDGTYLGFKDNNQNSLVLDCFLEQLPSEWKVISNSISDFFSCLIKKEGYKYWL